MVKVKIKIKVKVKVKMAGRLFFFKSCVKSNI